MWRFCTKIPNNLKKFLARHSVAGKVFTSSKNFEPQNYYNKAQTWVFFFPPLAALPVLNEMLGTDLN